MKSLFYKPPFHWHVIVHNQYYQRFKLHNQTIRLMVWKYIYFLKYIFCFQKTKKILIITLGLN